jgi:hypothetical protein
MPRTAEDDEHEPPDPDNRDEAQQSELDGEAEQIAIPDDLAGLFGDDEEQP